MSWDSYVTNMMTPDQSGTVPIRWVGICGINPPCVWASSPGITVTPDQIKALCGSSSAFAQCGPHIGPYKCRFLRDNKDTEGLWCIDFKTMADAEGNSYSVCVGFTKSSIIIAIGTKEASGGQISAKMHTIIKHLRDSGM